MHCQQNLLSLILLGLFILPAVVYSQTTPKEKTEKNKTIEKQNTNKKNDEKKDILIIPIMGYSNETSVLLGTSFMFFIHKKEESATKSDVFNLIFVYTFLNQAMAVLSTANYFNRNNIKLKSISIWRQFPSRFYGIGPDTPETNREDYTPRDVFSQPSLLFKIFRNIYIGPLYRYAYFSVIKKKDGGILDSGEISGVENTSISASGLELDVDNRDNTFYPSKGFLIRSFSLRSHSRIYSKHKFYYWLFDARFFQKIVTNHILAFQYFMVLSQGDMPFQMYPRLGGGQRMRGYYLGRYSDHNYIMSQIEYRYPIYWRFSGAMFMSCGEVAPRLNDLSAEYLRYSAGSGVRFAMNSKRKIHLRFDFGLYNFSFKEDTYGFYFSFMEAF